MERKSNLLLWDTNSQNDFDHIRSAITYPDTNVVLIISSLDSYDSLKGVEERWNPEISHFCKDVPKILVGAKKDQRNDREGTVTYEQGLGMAQRINAVEFMECSAMYKEGLLEIFDTAARYALKHKKRKSLLKRCVLL